MSLVCLAERWREPNEHDHQKIPRSSVFFDIFSFYVVSSVATSSNTALAESLAYRLLYIQQRRDTLCHGTVTGRGYSATLITGPSRGRHGTTLARDCFTGRGLLCLTERLTLETLLTPRLPLAPPYCRSVSGLPPPWLTPSPDAMETRCSAAAAAAAAWLSYRCAAPATAAASASRAAWPSAASSASLLCFIKFVGVVCLFVCFVDGRDEARRVK